ncbi:MAG TPA: class I SAM-dependent methyltransferase [Candidatus Dormibacteraeota bacterium]|nr:class I SAM-dependent methyltransferase [Candidatus Dormibacteraeota bacterium]
MPAQPTDASELPDHVLANREAWDRWAPEFAPRGHRAWASTAPAWGIWNVPESELHLLPDDLAGRDAIELGCGTAYVSAWLARLGMKPVGIDNSPAQLETARQLQAEFGLEFPLLLGNAETLPFDDATFDFAISEYGAALWADPALWIPEAARVLRPGGRLVYLTNHAIFMLFSPDLEADFPAREQLVRPYFRDPKYTCPDETSVEFHLPHGATIDLLHASGFEVERLVEIQAPAEPRLGGGGALPDEEVPFGLATREWARQWPTEEVWVARKRA